MIQGEIESKSRAGDGIKVGGAWYNEGTPGVFAGVEWKQTVQFEAQQEGNRSVVYVAPVVTGQAQTAVKKGGWGGKGGGGGRKRTPQEIHGPIVGHNLLIAATILGPGSTVQQVIETGRQLMQASDALLQEVISSKAGGQATPLQSVQAQPQYQQQGTQQAQQPVQQQQQANPYTGTPQQQYAPQGQPQQFNDDIPF